MAITTTEQTSILNLVVSMFNAAPGAANLTSIVASYEANGRSLTTLANNLAMSSAFTDQFAGLVTNESVAAKMATNFGMTSGTTAYTNAYNYFVAELAAGKSKVSIMKAANDYLLSATKDPMFNDAAAILVNKTTVALDYSVTKQLSGATIADLRAAVSGVDATAASVTTKIASLVTGQTFTLTAGADTGASFTGTAGSDTFNAGTLDTWSAFDAIDGGAGVDTMTALVSGTAVPGSTTITNVETLNVNTTGAGYTINTTGYTGMTAVNVSDSTAGAINVTAATTTAVGVVGTGVSAVTIVGGTGTASVTTGAGAVVIGNVANGTANANTITAANVTGGTTVAVTDNSGALGVQGSTLKTVSLNGNTGAATITANGVTTLNLTNNAQNVTVTDATVAASSVRALTVNLNTATGGIISDTKAATVTVNSNGTTANTGVTLTTVNATTANINATGAALTLADVNLTLATAINFAGDKAVTTTLTSAVNAAAVITSTNTAGVTIAPALGAGVQFIGGDGADSIALTVTGTKAMSMGAGNDTVTYAGVMGTGGSVDAGTGTDTIKMTAAAAVTATASTAFAATVSNFEKLELSAATGAAAAINMANADGINSLVLNGVTVGALTVTNAAAGFTYTNKAAMAFASSIALASDVGTSDTVNVIYTAADGFADTAAMTIANVENINITTTDADTTAQTTQFTANIVAAAATTVTISGDTGVIFTNTNTAITSLNASGLTGTVAAASGLTWTTGALAASSTITGSASATNTVTFSAANTAATFVTYNGGAGNDTITGSNGLNNVVTLGNGTNSFTSVGAGNNTITGGTGVDTITVGSGNNTISTGAGADIISFGGGMNTITGGAGNDNFTITAAGTNVNTYSTIMDATAGDILTFTNLGTETFATAKLTLGDTAVFQDYANLAAAGAGNVNAAISWFQFAGNTYVVQDVSAGASFVNGTDLIIKLSGLVDLSTATGAGTNAITLV